MGEVEIIRGPDFPESLEVAWRELYERSVHDTCSFNQFVNAATNDPSILSSLVLVIWDASRIVSILPMYEYSRPRRFTLGEITVLRIPHRVLHVAGAVLGSPSESQAEALIARLVAMQKFDCINLYELPVSHPLMKAATANPGKLRVNAGCTLHFPHWLADFPDSFDAYLAGFKAKTRSSLKRKLNRLRNAHELKLEVVTEVAQLEHFLSAGEKISRQTYQWDLGVRLENNAATRSRLSITASEGELRCYLLYADGDPIVFMPGTLVGGVFHYGSPGFLRKYAHLSPGTVMLLLVFEDLIENTDCRCFDFGMGGDYSGYKAMFGNRHYEAAVLEIFPGKTARSRLIHRLDRWFWSLKRALKKIVSPQAKSAIKRGLRRIGLMK